MMPLPHLTHFLYEISPTLCVCTLPKQEVGTGFQNSYMTPTECKLINRHKLSYKLTCLSFSLHFLSTTVRSKGIKSFELCNWIEDDRVPTLLGA
jgi:hypothetical protein